MHTSSSSVLGNIFECQVHDVCLGCAFEVMECTLLNYLDDIRKGNWQGMLFFETGVLIIKTPLEPNNGRDALWHL